MSTSSTYEITGRFNADQMIARFKEIDKLIKQNEKSLKTLSRAAADMEKAQRMMTRSIEQAQRAYDRSHSRRMWQIKEQDTALARAAKNYDKYFTAGGQAISVIRDSFQGILDWRHEAKSLAQAEARFKALNLGAGETKKGLDAIKSTVDVIGGVRLDTLTDDLTGLKSVFGDLKNAIEFLPTAAKTRFTFQTLYSADPAQAEREITDTMKALEQIGAMRQLPGGGVDKERLGKYFDAALRVRAMTGGRVGGAELRQFVQTSGVAGMALEPEGLINLVSVMEAMGGGQTGTALMSAFMQFRAFRQGAGGARAAHAMQQLGLLKKPHQLKKEGLAEFTREGRIKKLMPGAMPIAELLGKDPLQFADALANAIGEHGHKLLPGGKKANLQDAEQVATVLTQITGSRTAANVIAKMIVLRENIRKDAENLRKAMGGEEMFKLADESDVGKILKFEAALTNFKAKAGIPLIAVLGDLAEAGKPLLELFSKYPEVTLFGLALIKVGSAAARLYAMFRMLRMSRAITDSLNPGAVTPIMGKTGASWGSTLATTLKTTVAAAGIGFYIAALLKDANTKQAMEDAAAELAASARKGIETDLTSLDAKGREQAVRSERMKQSMEDAQKRVYALGLAQGPNEQNILEGMFGLDGASKFVRLLYGFKHGQTWQDLGFGMFSRSLGSEEQAERRKQAMSMLTSTPFKTDAEVGKFLESARLTLEKAGAGDLFPILKQLTEEAAPDLLRSYEEHQKVQQTLADQTRLTGNNVKLLGDKAGAAAIAIEAAAARLGGVVSSSMPNVPGIRPFWLKDDDGQPLPGRAKGGLTRRAHAAVIGEDGPELITPLDRVGSLIRNAIGDAGLGAGTTGRSGGPLVAVTVPVTVQGNATPGVEKLIAKAVGEELERTLIPMLYNNNVIERILATKMDNLKHGAAR
jgi:hypothetical protein